MMKNAVHQRYNDIISSNNNYNNNNNVNSDYYNANKASKISFKEAVLAKPPLPVAPASQLLVKEEAKKKVESTKSSSSIAQLGQSLEDTAAVVAKRKSNRKRRGRGKSNKNKSGAEIEDADEDDDDDLAVENQKAFDLSRENFPGLGGESANNEQSDGYSSGKSFEIPGNYL
jgi:hypothetical protein